MCLQVKLSDYIGKKYVILFFYPLDFTFVCPTGEFETFGASSIGCQIASERWFDEALINACLIFAEITAFSGRYEEFEKLNTEILGVSIDSVVYYKLQRPELLCFM